MCTPVLKRIGKNFIKVTIDDDRAIWFSYETAIAFYSNSQPQGLVIQQNRWGATTGKHLKMVTDNYATWMVMDTQEGFDREFQATFGRK